VWGLKEIIEWNEAFQGAKPLPAVGQKSLCAHLSSSGNASLFLTTGALSITKIKGLSQAPLSRKWPQDASVQSDVSNRPQGM
jgi:hypothetical protein